MSGAFNIRVISEWSDFAALEPEWWTLWRRVPEATPFQSPAWLIPWWAAFAPGELRVVAIHRGEALVGLAPFYIEIAGARRRLLPLGISISDYLDVLLDPISRTEAADALCAHVADWDWGEWELADLSPEAAALRIAVPAACEDNTEPGNVAPVLDLAGADSLEKLLPKRKRRSLRMVGHRAARRGKVEIIAADPGSADEMLRLLVELHSARWQSQGEEGVLADPRLQCFHADALPRLMRAGLARLYGLRIGGAPAAAYYGFHDGARAYAYLTGFDPAFAYESPGALLLAHAIERAMAEGAREFHFLRGGELYKYGWGAKDRTTLRRILRRMPAYAEAS